MNLSTLGYTEDWIKFGFINMEDVSAQLDILAKGEDTNTEHYRFKSIQSWLAAKERFTNQDIENFLALAKADSDQLMAGSALRLLFESSKLSDGQFETLKLRLPDFGDWTKKLIQRLTLQKRLEKEEITPELYQACLQYKKDFKDNRLLFLLIKQTKNPEILTAFADNGSGKQLRKLAEKRLRSISK